MQATASWQLRIERGPEWLFVAVDPPDEAGFDAPPLADMIWNAAQQHRQHRLVLELDRVDLLHSYLIGQLVLIARRVYSSGGLLRLTGVSEMNVQALRCCRLEGTLPIYDDRHAAVLGQAVVKPR